MGRKKPGRSAKSKSSPSKTGVWKTLPVQFLKWMMIGVAALIILPWFGVLLFLFVNPPFSAFMAERYFSALVSGNKKYQIQHQWVPIEKISPNLALAVITSEDQLFIWHDGFDFEAIDKALERNKKGRKIVGASTISQQVAKNVFLWPSRSWVRKGVEAYLTFVLEVVWPKKRILEMYLNYAEMGEGIFGAGAVSRIRFHKDASKLTAGESALVAAILPSPVKWRIDKPSPRVLRRQAWIQSHMYGLKSMGYYQMVMGKKDVVEQPRE